MSSYVSSYYHFNEQVFRSDVKKALLSIEKILEADRRPRPAEEVHHKYENKFQLANSMTNLAIVAQMNVLERLGLTPDIIRQLGDDIKTKTTTLRFDASESCEFIMEQTVDVHDANSTQTVSQSSTSIGSSMFNYSSSTIHKVIKKVKEYHWNIKTHWEIAVFPGTEVEKRIVLQSRDASIVVITQSKEAPIPTMQKRTPMDLNLTWVLKQIDMETRATNFTIDTTIAKTPRRNQQVEAAMAFFCKRMKGWLCDVKRYFTNVLQPIISKTHNPAVAPPSRPQRLHVLCSANDLFRPILPLLEETDHETRKGDSAQTSILDGSNDSDDPESISTLSLRPAGGRADQDEKWQVLSGKDTVQLLNSQVQSIVTKIQSLQQSYPPSNDGELFSIAEATVFLMLDHSEKLCLQYQHAIGYLEKMLENQLVAAIGKRVTNDDLEEFVRFHNAKFLTIPPKPFCHAIGRPNRFPYGVLSIESKGDSDNTIPIETMMRPVQMEAPLEVPLNAATTLQLTGNTYLHGWMHQRSESGGTNKSFQLSARARQFSSFMLVIGTMAGPNKLNPKDAIILQNKDEVLIPLLLEEIPSAKEFKDAIESLSPEQQRFAKSFRGMQLESSVFGVAVIQIKPQLEALLGLPEDSLAKEIKLTEDLMELFVEYQVPSDLLSYDELAVAVSTSEKVDIVRQNVKAVMSVVEGTKEKQLEDKVMVADMVLSSGLEEASLDLASLRKRSGESRRKQKKMAAPLRRAPSRSSPPPPPPSGAAAPRGTMSFGAIPSAPPMLSAQMSVSSAPMPSVQQSSSARPTEVAKPLNKVQPPVPDSSSDSNVLPFQAVDFTSIPKTLDATIEKFDKDSTLRSTKLKTMDTWSRKRQPDLLTKPTTNTLAAKDVKSESNKAYDLLDAISRSGSLPIAYSDLHVVVCVTHCFEKDVMATVVEDNVNPIEKLEMSTLLLGSAIHGAEPLELIAEETDRVRFESSFPRLLEAEGSVNC